MKNEQKNIWYKLNNQNLAIFMRESGFDLAVYNNYTEAVQKEAKRKSINVAISSLRNAFWDKTECNLGDISSGVYVIRLSGNMSVQYRNRTSPIIYIGEGSIENRIKNHYQGKLFDFMLSLNGMNFDFHICDPWKSHYRYDDFHKQIEFELLHEFSNIYGGLEDSSPYPLMNTISGSERGINIANDWWKKPLRQTKARTNWILRPGPNSEFIGALD